MLFSRARSSLVWNLVRSAGATSCIQRRHALAKIYLKKLPLGGAVVVLHAEEAINGSLRGATASERVPRVYFVQVACLRGGRMMGTSDANVLGSAEKICGEEKTIDIYFF